MQLIDNVKQAWKFTSVQIAVALIALDWVRIILSDTPQGWQGWLNSALLLLLPIARVIKQNLDAKLEG